MSNNTGGPAFPAALTIPNGDGTQMRVYHHGMTLRDYFAAKAMQGMLAGALTPESIWSQGEVAETAYSMADAMLKAREESNAS